MWHYGTSLHPLRAQMLPAPVQGLVKLAGRSTLQPLTLAGHLIQSRI